MTDAAAPAGGAAPVASPEPVINGGRPTFHHPAIPPPKSTQAPARTEPTPEIGKPAPAKAADVLEEPEAKLTEPEPESDGPEDVEYFPDDEFVVTVNGQERTVTMAKLLASYQRNEASNERFLEAKRLKDEAISTVQHAMSPQGFIEAAKALGKDPYEIAETIILERYEYEQLSPQEREMRDYRRERDSWEKTRAQEAQAAQQRAQEQEAARFQAHFLDASTATMDRLRVPADPGLRNELISRAAGIYRADRKAGYDSTPQAAMNDAWDEYQQRLEQHARALPVERRLTDQERATIAQRNAAERVRVAQQAPKSPVQARDDSGKFAPASKPRMDMWNPQKR